jgi:hypothetical protein
MLLYLIIYPLLGAGIKYIDAAFDEKTFSKKLAMIIAPLLGVLWAYTMLINSVSATILLAIVAGVFLTGKIDNYAHIIGMLCIFMILLFVGVELMLIPLILLILSGIFDEIGNDFIDKNKNRIKSKKYGSFLIKFFEQRWTLKVAVFGLVVAGVFPWYFLLALLLFDYAYLSITLYSKYKQGIITTSNIRKSIPIIGFIFK